MPNTPLYNLRYPDDSFEDDVPADMQRLAFDAESALEALAGELDGVAGATSGALGSRPAAADAGANVLFVATDGTNAGRAFLSTGSAWVELAVNLRLARILAAAVSDVPLRVTAANGQTADLLQVQNNAGTNLVRVTATGRIVPPINATVACTYDGSGRVQSVTVKDASNVTLFTSTFTYSGANTFPATRTDVGDGRTDTYTYTWNGDGTLASVAGTRS